MITKGYGYQLIITQGYGEISAPEESLYPIFIDLTDNTEYTIDLIQEGGGD